MTSKAEKVDYVGMLSDMDIRYCLENKLIEIFTDSKAPEAVFNGKKQIQPGSIDLRFRRDIKRFKSGISSNLTMKMLIDETYLTPEIVGVESKLEIKPNEVVLATTLETVILTQEFAGLITGRSSIARLGLMVQCCQDFINPGHKSPIPLQLVNLSPYTIELDLNTPICQLVLFALNTPSTVSYAEKKGAKYADEEEPKSSEIYKEMGNDSTKNSSGTLQRVKKKLLKYVKPLVPSLIMLVVVTPLYQQLIEDKSIAEIWALIPNLPVSIIVSILLLGLYVLSEKEIRR